MEPAILSAAQIRDLNSKGHRLDESGDHLYVQSFLINSEQNAAADPDPFKIKKSFVPKLIETAVGRPWIPETLPDGMHIRPFEGATAEEIIEYQKEFAGGEMVESYVNPETGNASVIIDIFPEYRTAVREGKIKPFVSPMIGNWNRDENGEVYRGEILHLQSVDTPGYDPSYAKFSGTCQGSLNQCMAELRPIAASGRLGSWRKHSSAGKPKKFSNTTDAPIGAMSMPESNIPVPGGATDPNGTSDSVAQQVGELIQKEQALEEKVSEIELVEEEIKSTVEKVQSEVSEIKVAVSKIAGNGKDDETDDDDDADSDDDAGDDEDDNNNGKKKPPAGAAGQQLLRTPEYRKLAKEHSDLKRRFELQEKETQKKLDEFNEKERKRQAAIIVKSELLQKKITPDKKDDRIKYYIELKDSADKPRDISLLAEESERNIFEAFPESSAVQKEEPAGSYGLFFDDLAFSGQQEPDYDSIEREILEG